MATVCAACAFACVLVPPAGAADATRNVHGSADAFATPGLALAWAVLRAPKEDDTAVVIRIVPDARTFGWIEVVGKDPLAQREKPLLAVTAVGGAFDLRVPRAAFADFPRTEFRLWQGAPAPNAAPPALIVYYLGVPDTTHEVAQSADLDRSLSARIARALDPASKAP